MKTFNKKFNLTNKLSLLVVLSILISFGVLSLYFDSFLKDNDYKSTNKRMTHIYDRMNFHINNIQEELKERIAFVNTDKNIKASIELINNYQDKDDYNSVLLDEEKKIISKKLLDKLKLSLNNDMALYDKNSELISYIIKNDFGYQLNFISYLNGEKVLYSKYEHEEFYTLREYKEYKLVYFKHKEFYKIKKSNTSPIITYHLYKDELFIKSHNNIFSNNSDFALGHIEMTYLCDDAFFAEFSSDFDMKITTSTDKKYKQFADDLFDVKVKDNEIKIQQTQEEYIAAKRINTIDGSTYIVIYLQKAMLKTKLDENRNKLFLILFIIIAVTLVVVRYIFRRSLSKPLQLLMKQINKIERMDYSHSKYLKSGDELETISKNVNKLSSVIRSREEDIKNSKENFEYLSNHDSLTGLPNRRFFIERLDHSIELAIRNKKEVALIFVDLDEFKVINDTLGHNIGDELLQLVAQRLSSNLRRVDTIARAGGDEFHIIIENYNQIADVELILNKIIEDFKNPFYCGENKITTTASIGVSVFPKDGSDSRTLIKNSDMAMYKSKEKGRNNYSFFSTELSDLLKERTEWVNALKEAVDTCEEFFLVYQPKVSPENGKIIAIEALVRWNSSKFGLVNPNDFISLAEETSLIIPLGKWILKQACRDFVQLQSDGYHLEHVSINISSIQFSQSDMIETLKDVIEQTGINANQVELEITESYIATNEKKALPVLHELREMNIGLAIDDFGTGYSSLSYLQKLPVTRLKIDKSFVDNIPQSEESNAIAKAIIVLAKTFHLLVTAEGVETEAQLSFLKDTKCEEIQGYIYSKPLSMEKLVEYYDKQ